MDLLILDISCTYTHALWLSVSGFSHWMSCVQNLRAGCLPQSFGLCMAGQCPALGTMYPSLQQMCGHYASCCCRRLCSGVCVGGCFYFSWVIPRGRTGPMVAHEEPSNFVSHHACALSHPHKPVTNRSHLLLSEDEGHGLLWIMHCSGSDSHSARPREQCSGLSHI